MAEDEKKDEAVKEDMESNKMEEDAEETEKTLLAKEGQKEKNEILPPPPPPPPPAPPVKITHDEAGEETSGTEDEEEREEKTKEIEKDEEEQQAVEEKKDDGEMIKPPKKVEKEQPEEAILGLSPLIFGKYDLNEVEIEDPGLKRYINLKPVGIPHTGAKHANKAFGKTKVNIVERLINNLMRTEHTTGKKSYVYKTVNKAFDIIATRTKQNPVQVFIHALQNSSPKEEITRLRFGGISVPKAVDTSSSHRLDVALRNICKGAMKSSHKNKKRMEVCLAEEIILASKADMNSFAISKKEEMERIAASAR